MPNLLGWRVSLIGPFLATLFYRSNIYK